jgi:thioredoxin 1
MGTIAATTDATFDADVLGSTQPVLVDFWAEWCGPCRQIEPILEEISAEYGAQLKIVKLDTDNNPAVTARYGVTGIPTMNVYVGGEVVKTIVGAKPKRLLLRELEGYLG